MGNLSEHFSCEVDFQQEFAIENNRMKISTILQQNRINNDETTIKEKEYLQIRAIRLDTKSLMFNHSVANDEKLSFLAELIKTM